MVEVEFKFPVKTFNSVRDQLAALGAKEMLTCEELDEYFNHPLQDFVEKDLALRIRKVAGSSWLTFKGPNRDSEAKIREEIEIQLDKNDDPLDGNAEKMRSIWLSCGFISAATVEKKRTKFALRWNNSEILVCLDQVKGLGNYVELEVIVEDEMTKVATAKNLLASFALQLGLENATTKSYRILLRSVQ